MNDNFQINKWKFYNKKIISLVCRGTGQCFRWYFFINEFHDDLLFSIYLLFEFLDFPSFSAQNKCQIVDSFLFVFHIVQKFEFLLSFNVYKICISFKIPFDLNELIKNAFLVVFELLDFWHLIFLEFGQFLFQFFGLVSQWLDCGFTLDLGLFHFKDFIFLPDQNWLEFLYLLREGLFFIGGQLALWYLEVSVFFH